MSEHLPPVSAENPEQEGKLTADQLADANWSEKRFKEYGLDAATLNDYGKRLGITEPVDLSDKPSVYHFVHSLQEKLCNKPQIADQFQNEIAALQDDRFGPVTYRALEIALNQQNAKGLMLEVETGLNKPIASGPDTGETPTPTLRKPEKQGPWDIAIKAKKNDKQAEIKSPYSVSCKLRDGDTMGTIGASSGYGLETQTGHSSIGAVGADPTGFYKLLTTQIWPIISSQGIQLPKTIILVGLGTNGLTSSTNSQKIEKSIAENWKWYGKISSFLQSKGVQTVKYATLNPYGKKIAAIDKFNERIRQNPNICVDTNRAIATPDGKSFKPGYAAPDGLHLSSRGKKDYAAVIRQAA